MSKSNYLETAYLNKTLKNTNFSVTGVWLALYNIEPGEAGSHTNEVSTAGTGYRRMSASAWETAANGTIQTSAAITFPTASGLWGTVSSFGLLDLSASGDGNLLYYGALTFSKLVTTNDIVQVNSGDLDISEA